MFKGKIYRNKPLELENNATQSEFQQTNQLRRVYYALYSGYVKHPTILSLPIPTHQYRRLPLRKIKKHPRKRQRIHLKIRKKDERTLQ